MIAKKKVENFSFDPQITLSETEEKKSNTECLLSKRDISKR